MKIPNPYEYYPRMHRGGDAPIEVIGTEAYVRCNRALEGLLQDLLEVFRVVEPSSVSSAAYGPALQKLIFAACSEFEAQCGGILRANGYPDTGRWTTQDYFELNEALGLQEYGLCLAQYAAYPEIRPFQNWTTPGTTASLAWFDVYNKLKHRNEECYHLGSIEVAVEACAAVLVMCQAQFGWSIFHEQGRIGQRVFRMTSAYSHSSHEQYQFVDGRAGQWVPVEYFK